MRLRRWFPGRVAVDWHRRLDRVHHLCDCLDLVSDVYSVSMARAAQAVGNPFRYDNLELHESDMDTKAPPS